MAASEEARAVEAEVRRMLEMIREHARELVEEVEAGQGSGELLEALRRDLAEIVGE